MPEITRLIYHLPGNSSYTIDLAKDLSLVNRKLHRQKQTYTVLGGQLKESSGCVAYFKTAPHTWTTNVAIRRAFNTWRKVQREVYKKTPIGPPKWSDFKLYLDSSHTTNGTLTPYFDIKEDGSGAFQYQGGEWNYSTIVQPKLIDPDNDGGLEFDDNADSWDMQIVGDHDYSGNATVTESGARFYADVNRVGIIKSWFVSRATPDNSEPDNAPNTFADLHDYKTDPLSNIFDVQDDDSEQASVIESENDTAPYSMVNVPGMNDGELQLVAMCDNTAGEPDIVTVPGFKAPCGLVRISTESNNGAILMLDVLREGERI